MMRTERRTDGLQRSRGEASLAFALKEGQPRLTRLRQNGSARVIPSVSTCNPEVGGLNTSGGLTGGDRLSYAVQLGDAVSTCATTQTAERAYRSAADAARVRVEMTVGPGGFVEWLPQETILYEGASLIRETTVTLAEGANCLILETVVLGRAAMGETLTRIHLQDRRMIKREDRPVWLEALALSDRALATGSAGLVGMRAFATLCLVAPAAEDLLAPLRATLDEPGVIAGASAVPGRLMLRAHASDAFPLRRQMARSLSVLRGGRPLPRVWQM